MDKDVIKEMIECQGVYEITYKADADAKIIHVSNVNLLSGYSGNYIRAYCLEASKDLTFNIKKIFSIHPYWVVILSKETYAPKDGLYLLACGYLGQGIDITYNLLELKKGDLFEELINDKRPIAYHYIPPFKETESRWIKKTIHLKKWENEAIPALKRGIPIIAFQEPQRKNDSNEIAPIYYSCGYYKYNHVDSGVRKGEDITVYFKECEHGEPLWWAEKWDSYIILGYILVQELDVLASSHLVKRREQKDPDFLCD